MTQMPAPGLRPALLLALAQGPAHGYGLRASLDLPMGRVYRELRDMESLGLVTSATTVPERGPNKNVYTITLFGWQVLEGSIRQAQERMLLLQAFIGQANRVVAQRRRRAG